MSTMRQVLRLHKWLALLVGGQMLIWGVSGLYMVSVHIDTIHGDMLVKTPGARLEHYLGEVLPVDEILDRYPASTRMTLKMLAGSPVYQLDGARGPFLVDAYSGNEIGSLDQELAERVAREQYAGPAQVLNSELIHANPPVEIQYLPLPVWRVDFDDQWGTSFYVDPATGNFVTRRHTLWRVFDFLWMLHIMDYEGRENTSNLVLRVATPLALLLLLSGAWLLYFRLRPRRTGR